MTRNAAYVVEILESNVRIFYYLTDEEEKADTPEQKIMLTLRSYASEVERLKAGQRSRDALERKAAKGYNSGGIVYGYDNVPVYAEGANGEQVRTHTDYRINEAEADVLRRMFRMYADGYGLVTVARTMNGDPAYAEQSRRYFNGARPPSPRKGTGSWAPSSVRAMLYNERYTGIVPFGEHRKVYRRGTKARVRCDDSQVLRARRPDLRIIPDPLWRHVQAQLASAKKTYLHATNGERWGCPGMGTESKYLLTGLGTCGCCGSNIAIIGGRSGSPGKRHPIYYYGCNRHKLRGPTICANDHRARMEEADELVISRVQESILTPSAFDYVIGCAMSMLAEKRSADADVPKRLEAELRKERRQRDNLIAAVADGKAPLSVIERIAALEVSIADKERELHDFKVQEPTELELRRIRRGFRERLGQFNDFLRADVPQARQALRKLLSGRIEFLPQKRGGEKGYRLRWKLNVQHLVGEGYLGVASPRGLERYARGVTVPFGDGEVAA